MLVIRKLRWFAIAVGLLTWSLSAIDCQVFSEPGPKKQQIIYVPVYSHIYSGDREQPVYLAVTLSIRNTDMKHPITVVSVDYYDSEGNLDRSYVKDPIQVNAMASTRYVVKESDKTGGSGAKFIVRWESDMEVNEPIVEAIMISTRTQLGISFVSRGKAIQER